MAVAGLTEARRKTEEVNSYVGSTWLIPEDFARQLEGTQAGEKENKLTLSRTRSDASLRRAKRSWKQRLPRVLGTEMFQQKPGWRIHSMENCCRSKTPVPRIALEVVAC